MDKFDRVDDMDRKTEKTMHTIVAVKKARMFLIANEIVFSQHHRFLADILEEHCNDGQVHPVEMDELT